MGDGLCRGWEVRFASLDTGETSHLIPLAAMVAVRPRVSPRFPTSRRRSANNAAGLRGLASGGRLNGSEQTAGAGEQTQQPHQKAKRPWTDEVRRPGQTPKTRNAAERPRNTDKWMMGTKKKDSWYTKMRMMRMRHRFIHWHLNTHQSDLKWEKRWISPV